MGHHLWLGIGAFLLASTISPESDGFAISVDPTRAARAADADAPLLPHVSSDPVAFLAVLDAVSAHYIAGIDTYLAGDKRLGATFMTTPIGDIWDPLEDKLLARGVRSVAPDMQYTASLAQREGLPYEVQEGAIRVLAGLRAAASRAPGKPRSVAVQVRVIAVDLDVAARDYQTFVDKGEALAYIRGYGYYKAARVRFESVQPILHRADPDAAREFSEAFAVLKTAFRSVQVPEKPADDPGMVAAIVTRIMALSDEIK